jgi:hypothetical protein
VLVDFIYENDLYLFFIARGQKVSLTEKADSHVGDSIRLRKKQLKLAWTRKG